eukprot:TRINITY_DN8491_c0_g1_i2.p1 TRINITY_DN8491_c0_g1~~TRINITY_DN8491_c0_g1_i2.p1  ORF type:complete len:458 (+),score=83.08 TRINITY_DN8491_c0_g1_i2:77-1450(+)
MMSHFNYQEAEEKVIPIAALTELHGQDWFIKARVTDKSGIREYHNARGPGRLGSVTLVDQQQGAIRATFFNEGVSAYFEGLQPGEVYYFGHGRVKTAQKKWTSLPHDYEISFDQTASVNPVSWNDTKAAEIPTSAASNFTTLKDVSEREPGSVIDLVAIIRDCGICQTMSKKAGGSIDKRTIQICDNTTDQSFDLTLWETQASSFNGTVGSSIVTKNARIGKFRDAIQLTSGNTIEMNAACGKQLEEWWHCGGKDLVFQHQGSSAIPRRVTRVGLDQVEIQQLGKKPTAADFIDIRCTICAVSDRNQTYSACSYKDGDKFCHKKLTTLEGADGSSGRCAIHNETTPVERYITSMKIGDHTSHVFATTFDKEAVELFGMQASQLAANPSLLKDIKERVEWKPCLMGLRVKEDTFEGQSRIKYIVSRAKVLETPTELKQDCISMLRDIERYHTKARGIH